MYGARLVDCLDIDNNHIPNQTKHIGTLIHRMHFSNTETLSLSIPLSSILLSFLSHPLSISLVFSL